MEALARLRGLLSLDEPVDEPPACPYPGLARFTAANRDLLTFMGASYFQGHEPTDPLVSPLFGDLAGLPPLFVTATQGESLLSDTTRLAERAEKAGVDVTLRVVEDSVHVYTIFPFLPETKSTMEEVAAWAQRKLRRNDTRTQAAE